MRRHHHTGPVKLDIGPLKYAKWLIVFNMIVIAFIIGILAVGLIEARLYPESVEHFIGTEQLK